MNNVSENVHVSIEFASARARAELQDAIKNNRLSLNHEVRAQLEQTAEAYLSRWDSLTPYEVGQACHVASNLGSDTMWLHCLEMLQLGARYVLDRGVLCQK